MAETKTVRMLDTVEDSNTFLPAELDGVADHGFNIGGSVVKDGDVVLAIKAVDKIPEGATVTLPKRQAERLVSLGFAEEVV